ncbi:GntR family transcriptional regulator [Streptomyces sp. NPDC051567]|uniref:GntR family transcriptional regulator n=1 Tax=Streptomyces sp. NPDC051567 TaxID=3365660 RepID=UPI0037A6B447
MTSIIDALAEDLRERVFSGEIPVNALLPEAEVAGRYEVSRPTAKAAIEKLVAEGLLRRTAHKTAHVPELGVADVRDLYDSRMCIEREVLRKLAGTRRVPPGAFEAHAEIVAQGDIPTLAIVAPDMRFHLSLVDATGSPRMSRLYGSLMGEMRLCMAQVQTRRLLQPSVIAEEHQAILDRILDGDPDGVAEAVTAHLTRARDTLAGFLLPESTG